MSRTATSSQEAGVRAQVRHRMLRIGVVVVAAGLALALITTATALADPESDRHPRPKQSGLLNPGEAPPREILDCVQPTNAANPLTASHRAASTSLAEDSKAGNLVIDIVKEIGGDAFNTGVDMGYGWFLSLLSGQGESTAAKIDETEKVVSGLQTQVYAMCSSLSTALADLEGQVNLKSYQELSSNAQTTTAELNTYLQEYQEIVAHLKKGNTLEGDGDALERITTMRAKLPTIINTYDSHMTGDLTADGLIGSYADVLGDHFGYRPAPTQLHPTATRIFPAEYVHAAWVEYNSYAILVAEAAWLYAEVQNLDYTFQGTHYGSQPDYSQDQAQRAAAILERWAARIWGGRLQANQGSDWVTSSLGGDIADGTVADLRVQGHPRLWALTPAALTSDPEGTAYCGRPSLYCWSEVYDASGNAVTTSLVRSTSGPINRLLARQQPLGYDDWRVPTTADWNSLVAGASGGLPSWTSSHRLPALSLTTMTAQNSNGRFTQVSELPPMLVDTSDRGDGSAFGIVTGQPGANTLTTVKSGPDHEIAGLLYPVRDMTTPALSDAAPGRGRRHHHDRRRDRSRDHRQHGHSVHSPSVRSDSVHGHPWQRDRKQGQHRGPGAVQGVASFTTVNACTSAPIYTVPDGAFALRVVAVGAAGGAGRENGSTIAGGSGGVIATTIPVRAGQQFRVQVGGAGGTASGGGAGGVGGGAAGGTSRAMLAQPVGQSGGGGGFSGLASTDCGSWFAVAGGGGGAGAGVTGLKNTSAHMSGGRGGDACPPSGASCAPAGDGADSSSWVGSGHAGTSAPSAGGGSGGTAGANPQGRTGGGGGGYPATDDGVGGGGGGGGGYWAGGGGGSGGKVGGPGGGGAGGTSWAIGFPGTSYSVATSSQSASVTITPVSDVVIQSADNGQVLNISGASTDDGAQLVQWPRVGAWNEVWNLVPVVGGYQLRNPQSGKCAVVGGSNVGGYAGLILSTCADGVGQVWTVTWQPDGTASIETDQGELSIAGSANGVPVDVAERGASDPSHRWSVLAVGWPTAG